MANLVDRMKFDKIAFNYKEVLDRIFELLRNSISIVQESALFALGNFISSMGTKFEPYMAELFKIVEFYFNNVQYQSSCYCNLKGDAL